MSEWSQVRLDALGTVERGRSRHRPRNDPALYGGPYPFVQTGDIKAAGLRLYEYTQTYSEAGLAQSRLWPAGTLCFTIAANIGDTAILGIPACFPDSIVGFTADPDLADTVFVKYALDYAKLRFTSISRGATQDNLSLEKLLSQALSVPPLATQRRIASILGAYDDLIEVNRRRVAVLEEMARGLFEEWFVRFRFPGHESVPLIETPDGPLPQGWRMAALGDLCPGKTGIQTGPFGSQLHQQDYTDEGVPVVMPKNIIDLRVVTDGIARIPQALAESLARHIMAEGDIVYGRRGDIGRRAFISEWEDGFFCGTGCLRLRPEPTQAAPKYLFMALGAPLTEGSIKARATGATMPNLSVGVMKDVPVLQPRLDVQEGFCSVVEPMQAIVSNLLAANQRLTASRDVLLPRLISGQLSVETAERNLELAA